MLPLRVGGAVLAVQFYNAFATYYQESLDVQADLEEKKVNYNEAIDDIEDAIWLVVAEETEYANDSL